MSRHGVSHKTGEAQDAGNACSSARRAHRRHPARVRFDKSEELATLAPEAVDGVAQRGHVSAEAPVRTRAVPKSDPVTEMMVLERARLLRLHQRLVHHGRRHGGRSTGRVSAAGRARSSLRRGTLSLPPRYRSFPAGRAVREKGGYRLNGRWRFNSGIHHSEWVLGGTVVEGTEQREWRPAARHLRCYVRQKMSPSTTTGVMSWVSRGRAAATARSRTTILPEHLLLCLGFAQTAAAPRRSRLICCRHSAMWRRSTAASRSVRPGERSMSSSNWQRRRAAPSALRSLMSVKSCTGRLPKRT